MPTSHFSKIILLLYSHLRLGLPSGHLPSGFLTKTLYAPLLFPIRPCPAHLSVLSNHHNNVWWGIQSIKLLVMYSSPLLFYTVPLTLKYSPQHPFSENLSLCSSLAHPCKKQAKFDSCGRRNYWKKICRLRVKVARIHYRVKCR